MGFAGSKEINDAYRSAQEAYDRALDNATPRRLHHAETYLELGDAYRDDLELELFDAPGMRYLGEAAQSASAAARQQVRRAQIEDDFERAWTRKVQGQKTRAANNMFMQNVKGASHFDGLAGLGHSEQTHRGFTRMFVNTTIHGNDRTAKLLASPASHCTTIVNTHIAAREAFARAYEHRGANGEPNYASHELVQAKEGLEHNEPLVFARCIVGGRGAR